MSPGSSPAFARCLLTDGAGGFLWHVLLGGLSMRNQHHTSCAFREWPQTAARRQACGYAPRKSFAQAAWQIVVADVSMSLDNVLAVAGAAREHPYVLIFGLVLSIALMGIAANFIASLLHRYRWIGFVGLAIILYVALDMSYRGAIDVWPALAVFKL